MIGWGDKLKICKIRTKSLTASNQASTNSIAAMSSGAGLAAALSGIDKKDASTYVEISKFLFII